MGRRNACITSARMSMICDVISPHTQASPDRTEGGEGYWQWQQDDESGAIVQVWVKDDPNTIAIEGTSQKDVPLFAEGVLDGGLRVSGTTEEFDKVYQNIDWVKAVFPSGVRVTKRDQITNIRDRRSGEVLWAEEEIMNNPPTTFEVMGLIPVHFMGKAIEKSALLKRAEVQ